MFPTAFRDISYARAASPLPTRVTCSRSRKTLDEPRSDIQGLTTSATVRVQSPRYRLTELLAPEDLAAGRRERRDTDRRVTAAEDVRTVTRAVHPGVHRFRRARLAHRDVFGYRRIGMLQAIGTGHPLAMLASAPHQAGIDRQRTQPVASPLRVGLRDNFGFEPADGASLGANWGAGCIRNGRRVDDRGRWCRGRDNRLVNSLRLGSDAIGVIGIAIVRPAATVLGFGRNRENGDQCGGQNYFVHQVYAHSSLQK